MAVNVVFTITMPTPSNVSDETYIQTLAAQYVTGEVDINDLLMDSTTLSTRFEVNDENA